ncbi:MAG TPA: hypothetical protein VF286_10315 [Acidiphilium sp.]
MLGILIGLLDRNLLRSLRQRIALSLLGLTLAAVGFGFLVAVVFQAIALGVGEFYAALICGGGFVILALAVFAIARWRWHRRPRPLLARYATAVELLAVAQALIRTDPIKAAIAALLVGAMAEHLQKRSARKRDAAAE